MVIRYEKRAIRDLKKISILDRRKIFVEISKLKENFFGNSKVKKITNAPSTYFRLRVNNYRVIFDSDGFVIHIMNVRKRNEKTYKNL